MKSGSFLDLPLSVRPHNILTQLGVAKDNRDLVTFLLKEVAKSQRQKMEELYRFVPNAGPDSWDMITAGQRVQVMKRNDEGKAVLQFGTELIASGDGSIAGLLGASPGASTAPSIMLRLLERCFGGLVDAWRPKLEAMVPSYGRLLNEEPQLLEEISSSTAETLRLNG